MGNPAGNENMMRRACWNTGKNGVCVVLTRRHGRNSGWDLRRLEGHMLTSKENKQHENALVG